MQKNTVYQVSTASSLINGKAEGVIKLKELFQFGNFGIGAINHYNGELIIKSKRAFIANYHGSIIKDCNTEKSPFALITHFTSDKSFNIVNLNQTEVYNLITSKINSENIYAIKITGSFNEIILRSGDKQKKPYPCFTEIIKKSNTFRKEKIRGSMIGFYFPELFEQISTSHYHFHFIDENMGIGGHVCDFSLHNAKICLNEKTTLNIMLPKPES